MSLPFLSNMGVFALCVCVCVCALGKQRLLEASSPRNGWVIPVKSECWTPTTFTRQQPDYSRSPSIPTMRRWVVIYHWPDHAYGYPIVFLPRPCSYYTFHWRKPNRKLENINNTMVRIVKKKYHVWALYGRLGCKHYPQSLNQRQRECNYEFDTVNKHIACFSRVHSSVQCKLEVVILWIIYYFLTHS